jgi:glutaconyl-CoA/methylmalonyl-CoA decarboxylase subunit gamma
MKKLRVTVEGKVYEVTVEILDAGKEGAPLFPPAVGSVSAAPVVSAPVASASVSAPVSAPAAAAPSVPAGPGAVASQLAGKIVSLNVKEGDTVKAGDVLLAVEAMKMNTYVNAPRDGKVTKVAVVVGDAVNEGQTLVVIE